MQWRWAHVPSSASEILTYINYRGGGRGGGGGCSKEKRDVRERKEGCFHFIIAVALLQHGIVCKRFGLDSALLNYLGQLTGWTRWTDFTLRTRDP